MTEQKTVNELLREQLELLAERSKETTDSELLEITKAMIALATHLTPSLDPNRSFRVSD